ncbi:hypothetical protein HPB47_026984, partial [Ixodes persulcatus]
FFASGCLAAIGADAFMLATRDLVRAKAQLLAALKQPTLQVGVHRDDYVLCLLPRHHGDHATTELCLMGPMQSRHLRAVISLVFLVAPYAWSATGDRHL